MVRRLQAVVLGAGVALLAGGAPSAHAHSLVRVAGSEISYTSSDATSLNSLAVTLSGSEIQFRDPTVDGGIDQGSCRPGETDGSGFVIEVFCPRGSTGLVRVDLGEREDSLDYQLGIPAQVIGGPGADRLRTAGGADVVVGGDGEDVLESGPGDDNVIAGAGSDKAVTGEGNDVIQAGLGADDIDAGPGDDDVRVRDGIADKVICGDGTDTVDADQFDIIDAGGSCEHVTRTEVAAASGAAAGSDTVGPRLRVGAVLVQRVWKSRRTVTVAATSSEVGTVATSGFVDADGLRLPIDTFSRRVKVAGGGARIVVRLSKVHMREIERTLRMRRRVTVALGVVATDAAGNSTEARAPTIRLMRPRR